MYSRFLKMFVLYGEVAAYLLVKAESKTLDSEDIQLAKNEVNPNSELVRVLGEHSFLGKVDGHDIAMSAIAFDLKLK